MIPEIGVLHFKTDLSINSNELLNTESKDLEVLLKKYNITNEILIESFENIRNWYSKQPHLPQGKLHDRQILGHLIMRGFSVERAKANIDGNFSARHRIPDMLNGRDPTNAEIIKYFKLNYWTVLPKKTANNYRVTIYRAPVNGEGDLTTIMKVLFMMTEYRVWNDTAHGDVWILDMKNFSVQLSVQYTPVMISKMIFYLSQCFGARLKKVYLINVPTFALVLVNMFTKSIKPKLAERAHVSSDDEPLNKFSKDILPIEYGGNEISCKEISEKWLKTFQSEPWTKYLLEQERTLSDESKRPSLDKLNEYFGIDGSFRKLNVD